MLLSPVADILSDLGFDQSNMPNITNAATAALEMAETALSAALGTTFLQQTVTDQYFIKEPTTISSGNTRTVFRLTQGFLDPTVMLAGTSTEKIGTLFDDNTDFPTFTRLIAPDILDISASLAPLKTPGDATGWEKGILVDQTNAFWKKWVSITYRAGFPVSTSDSGSYDLAKVPKWLQQASHIYARIMLQSNPSLEDPAIKLDTMFMQKQLDMILTQHFRYAPYAKLPDA